MENTSQNCISPFLAAGETSVGTEVCIKHLKASLLAASIRCTAVVTGVDGRKVDFKVSVWEEETLIGEGTQSRFVINIEKFMAKLKK